MNSQFQTFKQQITNPIKFRLFMLSNLPSAFFAGLKIETLDEHKAEISVQQKWFNKNPFRSIYFAILSMAAEVSTGIHCMGAIYKRQPGVSMLVVESSGKFHKKAVGKITFTCTNGDDANTAVEESVATGEGRTIVSHSIGKNEQGETVAEFWFTWSFKAKKN
jgi:hypothetical protein